jgi:glycosyltransferase involved in cell wall biosynthesis
MSKFAMTNATDWVVCQIGARENYAVARAMHGHRRLRALVTDAWSPDLGPVHRMAPRFALRQHEDLRGAHVAAPTLAAIAHESLAKLAGRSGWERHIERNTWFQKEGVKVLSRLRDAGSPPLTVFAYSYAAGDILAFARECGWRTVLGQIDPGIAEDRIVQRADPAHYAPKPDSYWTSWRRELELADVVVVNSEWSRAGLEQEGVDRDRIEVVPLACEGRHCGSPRQVPVSFSRERPLNALFLGQIIPRKGVRALLDAVDDLREEPIAFHFVGPSAEAYENELRTRSNLVWHGAVARDRTASFYQAADVFVFPTLSDGFGLTQLEALSFGLPVIASRHCGDVVLQGKNGLVLEEVTRESIASALWRLCQSPAVLATLQQGAASTRLFGIEDLYQRLTTMSLSNSHALH